MLFQMATMRTKWHQRPAALEALYDFERLLLRLRQKYPFPIPEAELLPMLFPQWYCELADRGADDRHVNALCVLGACRDFCTVNVECGQGAGMQFWIRLLLIRPAMGGDEALVKLSPIPPPLQEWLKETWAMERTCETLLRRLEPFARTAQSPSIIKAEWPWLHQTLKLKASASGRYVREGETVNLLRGISAHTREQIETLHAAALMLPDRPVPAWVGLWTETGVQ